MAFYAQQPPSYDAPHTTLTPYLQLPHLLSLTWLAYPIISLIFVAFRLSSSLDAAQNAIASAKDDLLASCRAAEEAATSAASMPRYMALATNQQFADAVNASLRGARTALTLSLTVMEAIINFIIDLYRSIFLCFLELVVRGGLAILIGAVNEVRFIYHKSLGLSLTCYLAQQRDFNRYVWSTNEYSKRYCWCKPRHFRRFRCYQSYQSFQRRSCSSNTRAQP